MFGFLNINKPSGISSHKVVSILRKITGIKQIGHGGTLDPLASGVLPIAIGKASKLIDYLPQDKAYIAGLKFGIISDTYDIEGNITEISRKKVNQEEIEKILQKCRGESEQIPPAYSAVHYKGKRLYELARKGAIPNDIPKRKINIYKNEILSFDFEQQTLKLEIHCSKGTYIRSIVNDIGEELGTGAVMYELTRVLSSSMKLENSITITDTTTKDELEKFLINPLDIIPIKKIEITNDELKIVLNGNKIKNKTNVENEIILIHNNKIAALAMAEGEFIQPKKVLV